MILHGLRWPNHSETVLNKGNATSNARHQLMRPNLRGMGLVENHHLKKKPALTRPNGIITIINSINSDHFPISTSLVSGNHFEGGAFSALPLRGVKSKAPSPIFKADSARILGGVICGLSGRQCQPRIHRPWQPWSVSLFGVIFSI